MGKKSGAVFDPINGRFILDYFGTAIEVHYPSGQINSSDPVKMSHNDMVLVLQYLSGSCGVPPRGSWISFLQLPDGPHHHTPFLQEAVNPLADCFGNNIQDIKPYAAKIGAKEIRMGDFGLIIPAFPLIPLAMCLWEGDEEFGPGANLLFDVTAPLHLSTAALWVLGVEASRKLRGITGQQYYKQL